VLLKFLFLTVLCLGVSARDILDSGGGNAAYDGSTLGLGVTLALLVVAGAFLSVRLIHVERRGSYNGKILDLEIPGDLGDDLDEPDDPRPPTDNDHGDSADK
jgi:hypothetical protein